MTALYTWMPLFPGDALVAVVADSVEDARRTVQRETSSPDVLDRIRQDDYDAVAVGDYPAVIYHP